MFRFADPGFLLALGALPLIILWHVRGQSRRRAALRFSHTALLTSDIRTAR
ncbi:MAG: BatA domain-containing protein, partial [Gemmatimonadales bacterium]